MATPIGSNSIPPEDARRLITAHDGSVALLYIWQSINSHFDAEAAARDLCMTAGEVSAAKEKLDRLFSTSAADNDAPRPVIKTPAADTVPAYDTNDVKAVLDSAQDFKGVVEETARILGRTLSTPDISTLLAIYDHLGIPGEVMMELVHYCHEITLERFGPSKRVSVTVIYKEARRWAEEGILTFEAAEEYIAGQKALNSSLSRVAAMLNLDPRHITDTPLKYLRSWIGMGFDDESISEAYDRTFTNTGTLSWKYMDAIIKKWHNAGLHSLKEINEKDGRKSQAKPGSPKSGSGDKDAIAEFMKDSKNKD